MTSETPMASAYVTQEQLEKAFPAPDTPEQTLGCLEEIFSVYQDGVMEFIEINQDNITELFETSSAEIEINGQKYLFELKVSKL